MTITDKAIRYMNLSYKLITEINDSLNKTTYEPQRKIMEEQINALLWVNELVMREVNNEHSTETRDTE